MYYFSDARGRLRPLQYKTSFLPTFSRTIIIIIVVMSATAVPRGPNERGRVEHDGHRVLAQQVEPATVEKNQEKTHS